ncbi:SDR family NAD(P)-dependent oxidoreductase [Anabaena sp. CCY 0017]|uniref:SDR family NAD(P)-dependent oxidoreductase n=1 Tax=Anabaena sp. CCY 0017 TaxID=3103866 RepID=UPI0039C6B872
MDINNATILITGASQGIGRQLAIYFSSRVYEVIIASRNKQKLDETANLIHKMGGCVTALMLDLCDPQSIEALISSIRLSGKRIDILINNAANTTSKPLIDTSIEKIDQVVRTNVIGCLQLCRLVAPIMIEQNQGMIINISSLAGYNPIGS